MGHLSNWLQKSGVNEAPVMLAVHIGIVLLVVVVFNFILRRVLVRLEKGAEKTKVIWDDALISAIHHPATCLAWIVGLTFVARIILGKIPVGADGFFKKETYETIFIAVNNIRTIGIFFCFTWFLVRLIQNAKLAFLRRKEEHGEQVDRTTVDAICQLLRIVVIVIGALVCLQSLNVPISGAVAFGGVGAMAVGFAAKDMLANFFGSIMIHMDRPFAVGDWIRSPEKQIEGTVEEIGWRVTRIRTFDKRPLYVPNSVFTTITVENPSRMTNRRISEVIGVRYDDIGAVAGIVADIRAMLTAHPEIDQSQTLIVNLTQFNEYSLDIMVYTFTRTTVWVRFQEVKQDVLLQIANIIARHGAEIAFPTRISYSGPIPSSPSPEYIELPKSDGTT
jgi:MscS family membrane protein